MVFLKALNTPQAAIAASIAALIVLTGFCTSGPFHFDNPAGWLHEDHFSRYRWRAELRQDIYKFPYVVDKKLLARLNGLTRQGKRVVSSCWIGLLAAKHWGVPFIDVQ